MGVMLETAGLGKGEEGILNFIGVNEDSLLCLLSLFGLGLEFIFLILS